MSELVISDLRASVGSKEILKGVSLTVRSGEVHAVMGPNGSGKSTLSHVITGKPGYTVIGGSVTLDGVDLLALPAWERARAGLFLAMQYPTEVPGVSLEAMLVAAAEAAGRDPQAVSASIAREAAQIGFGEPLIHRALNEDLSGGEKKRNETVQLGVLEPRIAILDEIDSGLDVDAMRVVTRRIEEATNDADNPLGVLAITHYKRLFEELGPDRVHVFADGVIQTSGGPELAEELERTGYGEWVDAEAASDDPIAFDDPFGDTTFADHLNLHEG
ncbi:MAG: Fe-S cluster assembly ATPase SufC [Acidimicrobiales bacterium]